MTKATRRYVVAWKQGRWVIDCPSGPRFHSEHETREAAIWDGRCNAGANRPSVLSVHRLDGSVEAEFPYH